MPDAIEAIISRTDPPIEPKLAKTAVFYSISNCQLGLRGVSFGSFLIKQVVEELKREFEALDTFVTLSPIPGLRRWAREAAQGRGDIKLSEAEISLIDRLEVSVPLKTEPEMQESFVQLAAKYLMHAKASRGGPVDPVARFHLGNGACLERINPRADLSERGMATSWGSMVNYLYDLKNINEITKLSRTVERPFAPLT